MKKCVKQLVLIVIMLLLVFSLAGCGSKLIATKETEEDGSKVNYKYVIEFKKNILDKINLTIEYESKEKADEAMEGFEYLNLLAQTEEEKINVEQKDNKLIMMLDSKQFQNIDEENDLSKEKIKKSLEESGFKVK